MLGWLGWNLKQVRQREEFRADLRSRGAMFGSIDARTSGKSVPFVWTVFGVKPIGLIEVPAGAFTADDLVRFATLFPESTIREHGETIDSPQRVRAIR